jgi:hypothetical protein
MPWCENFSASRIRPFDAESFSCLLHTAHGAFSAGNDDHIGHHQLTGNIVEPREMASQTRSNNRYSGQQIEPRDRQLIGESRGVEQAAMSRVAGTFGDHLARAGAGAVAARRHHRIRVDQFAGFMPIKFGFRRTVVPGRQMQLPTRR